MTKTHYENSITLPYELKITVKSGHVTGGGLPNDSFVEVYVDGNLVSTTQSAEPGTEWNKVVTKKFPALESATDPIIISFSVFKKRWTSMGYKIVGTTFFPLSDLRSIVNTGCVLRSFSLVASKHNLTLCGTLLLGLELSQQGIVGFPYIKEPKMSSQPSQSSFETAQSTAVPINKKSSTNFTKLPSLGYQALTSTLSQFLQVLTQRNSMLDLALMLLVIGCIIGAFWS